MYSSLRPTYSGDTSLGKSVNRTYKDSVVNACQQEGIHPKLWTAPTDEDVPPWVFTKRECMDADKRMKCIIGPAGAMRIKNVMKAGKGENTHDTLEWAFTYARWCWCGLAETGRVYIENILNIFDTLCIMTASTLKIETVCTCMSCPEMS